MAVHGFRAPVSRRAMQSGLHELDELRACQDEHGQCAREETLGAQQRLVRCERRRQVGEVHQRVQVAPSHVRLHERARHRSGLACGSRRPARQEPARVSASGEPEHQCRCLDPLNTEHGARHDGLPKHPTAIASARNQGSFSTALATRPLNLSRQVVLGRQHREPPT
jgi:hypothetical protein